MRTQHSHIIVCVQRVAAGAPGIEEMKNGRRGTNNVYIKKKEEDIEKSSVEKPRREVE